MSSTITESTWCRTHMHWALCKCRGKQCACVIVLSIMAEYVIWKRRIVEQSRVFCFLCARKVFLLLCKITFTERNCLMSHFINIYIYFLKIYFWHSWLYCDRTDMTGSEVGERGGRDRERSSSRDSNTGHPKHWHKAIGADTFYWFYRCPYYVSEPGNISVALLPMQGQRALGFHQKYLNLCSKDEQRSYGFGTTWGWVINDRICIFGWTIPLKNQY